MTACLIFAGTLLPALGFFNVYPMLYYFAADHFQYLASIAMICLAMAVIHEIGEHWPRIYARPGKILAGVLLLVLGCLTWRQGYVYYDLDTLWQDTRTKNPDAWMAHYNLGRKKAGEGHFDLAIECFERTTQIDPRCASAFNNWGSVLIAQALEAKAAAKKALKNEDLALAQEKSAEARTKYELAREKVEQAVAVDRENNPAILYLLATICGDLEDYAKAIPNLEKALNAAEKRPPQGDLTFVPKCEYFLAYALLKVGRRQEALPHAQRAVELLPNMQGYQMLLKEIRDTK